MRTIYLGLAVGALAALSTAAMAEVTRFEITSRAPAFDGHVFGEAGAYERIDGIAHFEVDPTSDRVQKIVDIDAAPVNDTGMVEFSSEVSILRPTGTSSGTLVYELPNRGRNLSFLLLNMPEGPVDGLDAPGDGFLMNRGHAIAWGGWQSGLGDGLYEINLPKLDGVTGPSREEFVFDTDDATSIATLSYPAADMDTGAATLTVRATPDDPRETPDDLSFVYLDENRIEITRPEGFDAGAIYEFIYPATGAVPAGLGLIATSDLGSFLRGGSGHAAASPLDGIERTIGIAISQSGRVFKDFIDQGFNADEAGNRVFDGAMVHIAGSRKSFVNYRFAQAGRYSRQHEDHDYPGDQFPFTYADEADPFTGEEGSILDACTQTETCPKLIHTDTSTEFWQARAALVSTEPEEGTALEMPQDVRIFFLAGLPHLTGWNSVSGSAATCANPSNPASAAPVMRALVVAMEDWLAEGTAPPASVYPGLGNTGMIAPDALYLPMIDGARQMPQPNILRVRTHETLPPESGAAYPARVPDVDADGIPQSGVLLPQVAVPVGTYWGWNLRDAGFAPGDLCGLNGSFLPFPAQASEGDSRAPLSARYADAAAYRDAVDRAAAALVADRLMLEADRAQVVDSAVALYGATVEE